MSEINVSINEAVIDVTVYSVDFIPTPNPWQQLGWANYDDLTSQAGSPYELVANDWLIVPNDTLWPQTQESFLQPGIGPLFENNAFDLSTLQVGDYVGLRLAYEITPEINNGLVEGRVRLDFGGPFVDYILTLGRMDSGAGRPYSIVPNQPLYVGSSMVQNATITMALRSTVNADVVVRGYFIRTFDV